MKRLLVLSLSVLLLAAAKPLAEKNWKTEKHAAYTIRYTEADQSQLGAYRKLIEKGMRTTVSFFDSAYRQPFFVNIHPDRRSLDAQWQKDWSMPDFHSECWMVASGIATTLDLISPATWDTASCEHRTSDSLATQLLITHELVHVYHAQHNPSADFSATDGLDWLVEGLAVYASGQCDSVRLAQVKQVIAEGKAPVVLDDFWKGKAKYGLSGTMVRYIDVTYGRKKLLALLPLTKKAQALQTLGVTEEQLIDGWKNYYSH